MTDALDKIIHQPVRLKIMATLHVLALEEQVDFSYLKELLSVTDGNLGSHLATLEKAEYISIEKKFISKKPKTFISASTKGRQQFEQHLAALKDIINLS